MKLQVSVEFLLLMSILLTLLLIVVEGNLSFTSISASSRIKNEAKNLCEMIASEINLASQLGDGYESKFFVDYSIGGVTNFSIEVGGYRVKVKFDGMEVFSPIQVEDIHGKVEKGWNLIRNVNGEIHVG